MQEYRNKIIENKMVLGIFGTREMLSKWTWFMDPTISGFSNTKCVHIVLSYTKANMLQNNITTLQKHLLNVFMSNPICR